MSRTLQVGPEKCMTYMAKNNDTIRGITFVDVIVGTAIMSMVFIGLMTSFQAASEFAVRNRLRANALLIANDHLETIRALPYDSIGTVGGLPYGSIPQLEDIIYDGKQYTRRTFIQYVDDPADGTGVADSLAADYKRIKTEISYTHAGEPLSFSLVTTVAPKSQEALVGAGVLQLKVVDANNDAVPGATVHVFNDTIATSVDVTTFSNASGTVSLPGAWAGDGYKINISSTGYSSAQTYDVTGGNPAPSPGHANVIEGSVMELIFKIDLLSHLSVFSRNIPVRDRYLDTLDDESQLAATSSTHVVASELQLTGGPLTYAAVGTGTSVTISPPTLGSWLLLSFDDTEPASTAITYHVLYDDGTGFVPIPDTDLSGNTLGFTDSPVDLGLLDVSVYPELRVQAVLTSTDTTVTPALSEWKVSYYEADTPVSGVDFTLQGLKTIGTSPVVYKYSAAHSTDGSGVWEDTALEWDEYTLEVTTPSLTVAEACPVLPITLEPNSTYEQTLTLTSTTPNALQLTVLDPFGSVVPRAEVQVVGGAVDSTRASGDCGVAYFPSLANDTYTVSVMAPGLAPTTTVIAVTGETEASIALTF